MGQEQNGVISKNSNFFYQIDMRLIQKIQHNASSFSSDIEQIIIETQNLYKNQKGHYMCTYIINCINDRFSKLAIDQQIAHNSRTMQEIFKVNPVFSQNSVWEELSTKEKFLAFLQKLNRQYNIEMQLYQILGKQQLSADINKQQSITDTQAKTPRNIINQSQPKSSKRMLTIRKTIRILSQNRQTSIQHSLFKKMFLFYYLSLLRNFCSSKDIHQRQEILQFHKKIGRNICKIVIAQYLSENQLFNILYRVILLEKVNKSIDGLKAILKQYESECLKYQYNIEVSKQKLQKLKLFTQCYLDQLYLVAIRQAEDPQIQLDDDNLAPLKTFPIVRAKEKNRSM